MNEIIENMKTRRSIRKFKSDALPQDVLDRILEAGTYAPTGMAAQSPVIIAVTNKELRDKLSAMNAKIMGKPEDFDPFYNAPVVLVVLADKSRPTHVYDGSLVMGNLMLAAHSEGIGSCWIHRATGYAFPLRFQMFPLKAKRERISLKSLELQVIMRA